MIDPILTYLGNAINILLGKNNSWLLMTLILYSASSERSIVENTFLIFYGFDVPKFNR